MRRGHDPSANPVAQRLVRLAAGVDLAGDDHHATRAIASAERDPRRS